MCVGCWLAVWWMMIHSFIQKKLKMSSWFLLVHVFFVFSSFLVLETGSCWLSIRQYCMMHLYGIHRLQLSTYLRRISPSISRSPKISTALKITVVWIENTVRRTTKQKRTTKTEDKVKGEDPDQQPVGNNTSSSQSTTNLHHLTNLDLIWKTEFKKNPIRLQTECQGG